MLNTVLRPAAYLLLLLLFSMVRCPAQVFVNDEGSRELLFLAKVIQLDEFIHRFNNDSSSEIRRFYESHQRPFVKTRDEMIRSLFNATNQSWDTSQVTQFIRSVTDPVRPRILDFYGAHWFAEANCKFLYHSASLEIHLILRLLVNANHTAEWVIETVKPCPELQPGTGTAAAVIRTDNKRLFIQPTANETYFAELERDFADKRNLPDIFSSRYFGRPYSNEFYQGVLTDQIKFVAVKSICYHYLQVPDWIFTVEHFERETKNAGWLITSIRPVSPEEQLRYERKLLED